MACLHVLRDLNEHPKDMPSRTTAKIETAPTASQPQETRTLKPLTVTESFRTMRAMNELARKDPNLAPHPAFARTPANCASAFASSSYGTRNASYAYAYVRAIQDHVQSIGVADK